MTDDIRPTVDEHGVKRCSPLCPNFRSRYHGAGVTRARLVRECMLLQIEMALTYLAHQTPRIEADR
jgi:hypothetical protein